MVLLQTVKFDDKRAGYATLCYVMHTYATHNVCNKIFPTVNILKY